MIFSIFDSTKYNGVNTADIFKNLNHYHKQAIKRYQTIEYTIRGDFRPEQLAYELYGDSTLYWAILLINNMVDPYNDFILPAEATIQTAIHRYQYIGGIDQVHHHVDEDGRWWYNVVEDPENPRNWYNETDFELNAPAEGQEDYRQLLYHGVMYPVSVSEYEFNKNERKRTIEVLTPENMQSYVTDFLSLAGV